MLKTDYNGGVNFKVYGNALFTPDGFDALVFENDMKNIIGKSKPIWVACDDYGYPEAIINGRKPKIFHKDVMSTVLT